MKETVVSAKCSHRWARGGCVNTPPCRRHGGVHPSVKDPCGPIFCHFFAKSHPCLLIKPPAEKKFSHPGGKKILAAEGGRKFFL